MHTTDDHTRFLQAPLSVLVHLAELPQHRHAGWLLLAAAVAGRGCSDDAVALSASMPVASVWAVLPSMLDRCLRVTALLTAKTISEPGSLVCQLAAVDRFAGLISYITGYLVKLSVRQFLAGDVGQERLSLVTRILKAGELVTDSVAVEAVVITDIEVIACHGQSGGPGWGTRLPTVSEPKSCKTIFDAGINYNVSQ
jgi:hypothetical protein